MVGGGILEREIIIAKNGTEGNHAEDREMECCHQVMIIIIVITRRSKNRYHEKAKT